MFLKILFLFNQKKEINIPARVCMKLNYRLIMLVMFFLISGLILGACSDRGKSTGKKTVEDSSKQTEKQTEFVDKKDWPAIVFLGDSLTDGYGVAVEENYPSLVEKKLEAAGINLRVVNGGLSGDTSSGGLDRLEWFLNLKPRYLFLALGANDGLRGLSLEKTYLNLAKIIELCQKQKVKVLLTGLKLPPNYGEEYTSQFENIFSRLAKKYKIPLHPFLLEGVAGEPNLNLKDGIHPNPQGYIIISENVFNFISKNL